MPDNDLQNDRGRVELRDVTVSFGDAVAVRNVDLVVDPGEFLSILGPSGCGKTTSLRLVSGFQAPDSGQVWISGEDSTDIPPHKRDVNTVFQSYALFPHLTVGENVAYGLRVKKFDKATIRERVSRALDLVQMSALLDRRPGQMSGGQQQRVALARAIVNEPAVLLLDEPLSALDLKLRQAMRLELKHLHEQLGITFIFVTHDQEEAITMSDRVAVMNEAEILQVDTPQQVYEHPTSRFVASFIGEMNFLNGQIVDIGASGSQVRLSGDTIVHVPDPGPDLEVGMEVSMAVRPERVALAGEAGREWNRIEGTLTELIYLGDTTKGTFVLPDGTEVTSVQHNEGGAHPFGAVNPGDTAWIGWHQSAGRLLKE